MTVSADPSALSRGDEALERVRHYVIGFVSVESGSLDPEARSAGSGTLVDIDNIKGILTASHVVDHLREAKETGLVSFPPNSQARQGLRFDFNECQPVEIKGPRYTKDGPDIAFLGLPLDTCAALDATSSFLEPDPKLS